MQRRVVLGFLAVFLTIGTLLAFNSKLHVGSNSNSNSDFNWNDSWDSNVDNNNPNTEIEPVEPAVEQMVANSYQEALQMSGETGKAILVIFHGDSCQYCQKMKSEVLPDSQVKAMMKMYILVMVDTENRAGQRIASKYTLKYIPAFAITNFKEDNLKFEEKFMNVDQLVQWLNNPSLYNQPKAPERQRIEIKPQPEPDRQRRPG
tara:strand:- start:4215 stop:4826 length:612 start_codon:yes stop_codon:yes gene_type:complete